MPNAPKNTNERIVDAFRDSVKATLGWAGKNIVKARAWDRATQIQLVEKTGNMVAATFLHDVTRNNET
ncbi:MAG: relaxase domain-containing protein [Sphingobium sp.]